MLNEAFIRPASIAVIGASSNVTKPGGKLTYNLLNGRFDGQLYLVNPKQPEVQGIKTYQSVEAIEATVELAFIALPAAVCLSEIENLFTHCQTRSFVVISAGFSELGSEGAQLESDLKQFASDHDCQIWGPNCTGLIAAGHTGIFTTPVPAYDPKGVTLLSSSGATAVFLMEQGLAQGLSFGNVFSVGNGMMLYLEDLLEYLDETFDPVTSPPVILLYIESIKDPYKFHQHARSLVDKGCQLAAIKSGTTKSGSRAASSHTGALANPDDAVSSLMRKAGIISCRNRSELIAVGQVLQHKALKGNRIAVVTHAGGPGVMTADTLDTGGFVLPQPEGEDSIRLLEQLHPGSSVANPFDILATATEKELAIVLDYIDQSDSYDAVIVIFGSPGLFDEQAIFKAIGEYTKQLAIPLYTVAPSVINTSEEIDFFKNSGNQFFADESVLGQALTKVYQQQQKPRGSFVQTRHQLISSEQSDFLSATKTNHLLAEAGFRLAQQVLAENVEEAWSFAVSVGMPVVLKASDLHHKTDQKGIYLDIRDEESLQQAFTELRKITIAPILVQQQLSGHEIYLGINKDPLFGHQLFVGKGGIYLESTKDIQSSLIPVNKEECHWLISQLREYPIWKGARGQQGINLDRLVDYMVSLVELVTQHPEITEMDLNPLISVGDDLVVVDGRVKLIG